MSTSCHHKLTISLILMKKTTIRHNKIACQWTKISENMVHKTNNQTHFYMCT